MKVNTIKEKCSLKGIGIHSGKEVSLTFVPKKNGGIVFKHTPTGTSLLVSPTSITTNNNRATILQSNNCTIITPEHLLAACASLKIRHLEIHISENEVPIMDGSALFFVNLFKKIGLKECKNPTEKIVIKTPIQITDNDKTIAIIPSNNTTFSYYLHYPNHFIGTQFFSFSMSSSFDDQIAPARTYGFEREVNELIKKGLAKGGSLDNALIIGENDYINKPRFENELVRHKILDMMGDLWIFEKEIIGHIIGIKSGHELNNKLVRKLASLYS